TISAICSPPSRSDTQPLATLAVTPPRPQSPRTQVTDTSASTTAGARRFQPDAAWSLKLQGSEARDQRPVSNNPPERRSPCSGKFECRGVEPALRNQILPLPHESLSRMETNAQDRANEVIFLAPDAGRLYALGP